MPAHGIGEHHPVIRLTLQNMSYYFTDVPPGQYSTAHVVGQAGIIRIQSGAMSKASKHETEEEKKSAMTGAATQRETAQPDVGGAGSQSESGGKPDSAASTDKSAGSGDQLKADLEESRKKIEGLEAEVSSLKDQYLRKLADYENFRKRMFREKDDAVQYANSQILEDLVGVMDNLDRAVQSAETARNFDALHDGVDMIRKGMLSMLESKYGLARYESLGKPFDPNLHEAVMSEQGDCQEAVISEEFVKGYKLRERILRTAKVKVRMPGGNPAVPDGQTEATEHGKA